MVEQIAILSAVLLVIIPAIVALLKKIPSWDTAWCPAAAAVIGVLISIGMNAAGAYDLEMTAVQAGIAGFFQGLAAVGARSGIMGLAKKPLERDRNG